MIYIRVPYLHFIYKMNIYKSTLPPLKVVL